MSYWPFGRGLNEREQLTADERLRAEGERLAEADTVLLWGPEDRGCVCAPECGSEFRFVDIVGCARCHGDGHLGLKFRALLYPVEAGEDLLTFWAMCPTVNEPILMGFTKVTDCVCGPDCDVCA